VLRDADFYLCGPPAFMADLPAGLAGWGYQPIASIPKCSGGAVPDTGRRQPRRAGEIIVSAVLTLHPQIAPTSAAFAPPNSAVLLRPDRSSQSP